ncbi:MAG: hypothetical protein NTZ56_23030 [Acidobacteria bacterium]|nr:hypothetical protein [Acidobacteriota bacterium]
MQLRLIFLLVAALLLCVPFSLAFIEPTFHLTSQTLHPPPDAPAVAELVVESAPGRAPPVVS